MKGGVTMELLRRIWYLLNRRRAEREMENEMAFHREMAGRRIGSELRLREDAREVWGWTWLDRLGQDLIYGARVLRRSPGFTLTAVLVLGLGIGVTLSAVRIVLHELHPSKAPDPETLLQLERAAPGNHSTLVAWPLLSFYAGHARSFRSIMGRTDSSVVFGEEPEPVSIAFVTANYFAEFGIRAVEGRGLLATMDEVASAEPAAVLGRRFWERRLGGDLKVIGQTVRLAGKPVRVVGIVAAPGESMAIWMPLAKQPYLVEGSTLLTDWGSDVQMYGRLNPGISQRAAQDETRALASGLREQRPKDIWKGECLEASQSYFDHGNAAAAATAAATLVLLVLIVACTNLGTLLLARGMARGREIRTRMALGADRKRVVRQLLTESALLASLGCAAALLLSSAAFKLLRARAEAPEDFDTAADWRVLVATLAIGLIAAGSFGLAPALRLTSLSPRAGRSRSVFLAIQVGASCMLLMVSGLLVRGFERLMAADSGFDYRQIVVIQPGIAAHGYRGAAAQAYMRTLGDRLLSIPGVQRVSLMQMAPWGNTYSMENRNGRKVMLNWVDTDFLQTLGLRLTRGRNFRPGEQGVAIVSDSVARWQWPGEDPLGKSTSIGGGSTVVGVVRTAGTFNLRTEDSLGVYFPPAVKDWAPAAVVARVSGRPTLYLGTVAAAAKALDPRLTPDVHLLDGEHDRAIADSLKLTAAVGSLGTLATLLAAIGLAGLTAYTVGQRTREIGVRIALGARRTQVVRAVLAPMARPVVMGFAGGMVGAAALSSVLRREIFGLHPLDPLAYLLAIALFLAVMAMAAAGPARRAMRVNPGDALRHE
jgi:predicted permease